MMPALESVRRIQQKLDDIISKTSEAEQCVSRRLPAEEEYGNFLLIARDPVRICEPEIVRIGLNHGIDWYDAMYECKCKYLNSLVKGRNEATSLDVYVKAMEEKMEEALKSYEHPTNAECTEHVEIMLLDSCFIIESFRNYKMQTDGSMPYKNKNEQNIIQILQRDLLRIENQLPFFVLDKFFSIAQDQGKYRSHNLIDLAQFFFHNMSGPYDIIPGRDNIHHLLELVYNTFFDPITWYYSPDVIQITELEFIDCASELQGLGVKFNKIDGKNNFFEIKFQNGLMEIPRLQVSDNKLCLLQNLMAYEKQFPVFVPRRFNDYAKFMQYLVNSPEDVKLLRRSEIIDNQLGNNEVIFQRLDQLGTEAEISDQFTYSQLLKNVKGHCKSRHKVWMADLWRNYFKTPWTFISVLTVIALLSLTVTQTVFGILSYSHPPQPNK